MRSDFKAALETSEIGDYDLGFFPKVLQGFMDGHGLFEGDRIVTAATGFDQANHKSWLLFVGKVGFYAFPPDSQKGKLVPRREKLVNLTNARSRTYPNHEYPMDQSSLKFRVADGTELYYSAMRDTYGEALKRAIDSGFKANQASLLNPFS